MTQNSRPLVPVNQEGLDDIASALLAGPSTPDNSSLPPAPATNISNPAGYIILEGRSHGKYTYQDSLVAMDVTHKGKNWTDAHKALYKEGAQMLSIRQFVDFLNLLRSGKAYDGGGRRVDKVKLDQILDEIYTVRSPWRSEWLDANFKFKNGIVHMEYDNRIGAAGAAFVSREMSDYLAQDKTPGIDMSDWLANANSFGLPKPNVKSGSLYYWQPGKDDNSVARFCADSGRAYLGCGRDPSYTDSNLGVRAVRKKIGGSP